MLELASQISAFVGTSAVIYILTAPKPESHESVVMELSNPRQLKGAFIYSPEHRKRYFQYQESMTSANFDELSSVASERSNDTS